MTPLQKVYDAFFAKMLEDEWEYWTETEVEQDVHQILLGAIPWFKFPRVSLEIDGDNFKGDLSNEEIQILASFMRSEWLNRTILTWENVKPLYDERDFSQANLIDKFRTLLEMEQKTAKDLEKVYYRSVNKKPFDFTKLAKNE